MPSAVSDATAEWLEEESLRGGYETAEKRADQIEQTYSSIAQLIGARTEEIALMENATAAWNHAFFSIPFSAGDRILTSRAEYASNFIAYLRLQQRVGVEIEVVPSDSYGQASVNALQNMVDEKVKLISITHIPTNGGLVNPVEKIGDIASTHDILYLVDACQSIGQYPVDVESLSCDMLSATGRKFLRGPRGTGFLYVKKNILNQLTPPFLDLHGAEWTGKKTYTMRDDARRFENWEFNYAAVAGLNEAVKYALSLGMPAIWNRVNSLADYLRTSLSAVPDITVHDLGRQKCGIVTFTMNGIKPSVIKSSLLKKKINVSTSAKSSTLLDMKDRGLEELVRASVHYYNTGEEIDKFIEELKAL